MKAKDAALVFCALVLCAPAITTARAADEPQPAVWKAQEITFRYSGFASKYSCSGLRDKLGEVLLALGVRKDDLKLSYRTCGADIDRPAPFVSINVKMATLQVAPDGAANPVAAHWHLIDAGRTAKYERGDCELAEQVRQSLLPLFSVRKLEARDGGCTPRDSSTGSPELQLETLVADPAPNQSP